METETTLELFHGTSADNAEKIIKEGLRPSTTGQMGSGVYLAREDKAEKFAKDAVLRGKGVGACIFKCILAVTNPKFVHHSKDAGSWQNQGYDSVRCEETNTSKHVEWVARSSAVSWEAVRFVGSSVWCKRYSAGYIQAFANERHEYDLRLKYQKEKLERELQQINIELQLSNQRGVKQILLPINNIDLGDRIIVPGYGSGVVCPSLFHTDTVRVVYDEDGSSYHLLPETRVQLVERNTVHIEEEEHERAAEAVARRRRIDKEDKVKAEMEHKREREEKARQEQERRARELEAQTKAIAQREAEEKRRREAEYEAARQSEREAQAARTRRINARGNNCTWALYKSTHFPTSMATIACVAICKGGYVAVDDNGATCYHGISSRLIDQLNRQHNENIEYIAAGPSSQYIMIKKNGRSIWHAPDSFGELIQNSDSLPAFVAFGPWDSYFVRFRDGSQACHGVTYNLRKRLKRDLIEFVHIGGDPGQ